MRTIALSSVLLALSLASSVAGHGSHRRHSNKHHHHHHEHHHAHAHGGDSTPEVTGGQAASPAVAAAGSADASTPVLATSANEAFEIPLKAQEPNDPSVAIDPNHLRYRAEAAVHKIERNRAIYQLNTGQTLLGAIELTLDRIKDLLDGPIRLPPPQSAGKRALPYGKRQTASNGLTASASGALWTGPLQLGTPAQTFDIDFDTGSADLWVPSSACTSSACLAKTRYNPSKSSTSKKGNGTFSITYGDGTGASGPVYLDTVSVAGAKAAGQAFSAVTKMSDDFENEPDDGIGGMAFQTISNIKSAPFFNNLFAKKAVGGNLFAFKLALEGAVMHLGGVKTSAYSGQITYTPVTEAAYWTVRGSAAVNNKKVFDKNMVIDTGTTLIIVPPNDAKTFYSSIADAQPCSQFECGSSGFYKFPCNAVPSTSLIFSGRSFPISADTFNFGPISTGNPNCVGAVVGMDVGMDAWIVGDAFLQNVYSVYDVGNKRVGFATPK